MGTATHSPHRRPGRPRRSETRTSLDPKEEILRHAAVLFSANGIGATTVSDIARAVDVTPSAVYYHFAGRDDIVAALLSYVIEETHAFSATADASTAPAERLQRLIAQHVERLPSSPYDLLFVIGMSKSEARQHTALVEHIRAWRSALAGILRDGQEVGSFIDLDPAVGVVALTGLVFAALQLQHETGSVDADAMARLAVRSVTVEPGDRTDHHAHEDRS